MLSLQDYLDRALEIKQLGSDRALARSISVGQGAINTWRTGRSLPDDESMVKLARAAGISDEQGLLELSYWRSEGEARKTYESLLQKLKVTAAAASLLIFSFSSNAMAEKTRLESVTFPDSIVCIMETKAGIQIPVRY